MAPGNLPASDSSSLLDSKLSRSVLFLLFCFPPLLYSAPAHANSDNTVNYLVVEELAVPFQIASDGVHYGGIISDIVTRIFEPTPYQIKSEAFPVKRLHHHVRESNPRNWLSYDAKVWNSLTDVGDFIEEPLFTVKHSFLTCTETIEQVEGGYSIRGSDVAILNNFDYPELQQIKENGLINLVAVDSYKQGFNLVGANRVAGFVEMDLRLRYNLKTQKMQKDCMRLLDFSTIIRPYDIYLIIQKSASSELKELIAGRIQELKQNGELQAILDSY